MRSVPPLIAALALGLLGAGACVPAAARPAANRVITPAAPATAQAQPLATAEPSATAQPPEPAGTPIEPGAAWTEIRTEELAIRLPASWQADAPGAAPASLAAFEEDNPELAGFLDGGGAPIEAVFSARDRSRAAPGTADNLNIRRTALEDGGAKRLPEIAAGVGAQYRTLGFDVREIVPGIEIGGLPAARIVTGFPASGRDGARLDLAGVQWLAAAPDALWILTYTTTSERLARMQRVFEESAESFDVR